MNFRQLVRRSLPAVFVGLLGMAASAQGTTASLYNHSGHSLRLVPSLHDGSKADLTYIIRNYDFKAGETTETLLTAGQKGIPELILGGDAMAFIWIKEGTGSRGGLTFKVQEAENGTEVGKIRYTTSYLEGRQLIDLLVQLPGHYKVDADKARPWDVTVTPVLKPRAHSIGPNAPDAKDKS